MLVKVCRVSGVTPSQLAIVRATCAEIWLFCDWPASRARAIAGRRDEFLRDPFSVEFDGATLRTALYPGRTIGGRAGRIEEPSDRNFERFRHAE